MKTKILFVITLLMLIVVATISSGSDITAFSKVKTAITQATCVYFEFITTVDSDVFNTIDTSTGTAYFARDGRFNITIGQDQYIYDLEKLYSYSKENNQVTIEQPPDAESAGGGISFITRLDELYDTHALKPDRQYRLVKKPDTTMNSNDDIPDSLVVFLSKDAKRLERFTFYDINEDLNTVKIVRQRFTDSCNDSVFIPAFPDSVERIKL